LRKIRVAQRNAEIAAGSQILINIDTANRYIAANGRVIQIANDKIYAVNNR